jgi:outer membrane protein assembly factor BamD
MAMVLEEGMPRGTGGKLRSPVQRSAVLANGKDGVAAMHPFRRGPASPGRRRARHGPPGRFPPRHGLLLAGLAALTALAAACSGSSSQTQQPPRTLFQDGQFLEDSGLYTEAIEKFKTVSSENQGTRLGSFAYLRLAELFSRQEDWLQAETNYRLFLSANSNSHLNAYVLYRLLQVNDKKSYTGLFFKERELDRDMDPSKQIILEYKRFYLLYPQSIYAKDVVGIYRAARSTLAEHEILVADFYVRHGEYNSAANRYLYALRNFPELGDPEYALRRLIDSYRKDQQPDLADEMQRIYDERYGKKSAPSKPVQLPSGG